MKISNLSIEEEKARVADDLADPSTDGNLTFDNERLKEALSKLVKICERAIAREDKFNAPTNPYIEYGDKRTSWIEPMKKALAEIRAEQQGELSDEDHGS